MRRSENSRNGRNRRELIGGLTIPTTTRNIGARRNIVLSEIRGVDVHYPSRKGIWTLAGYRGSDTFQIAGRMTLYLENGHRPDFDVIEILGQGSYGVVLSYGNPEYGEIAVKYGSYLGDDIYALFSIQRKSCSLAPCLMDLVNARYFSVEGMQFIILDRMDGNLALLKREVNKLDKLRSNKIVYAILLGLLETFWCLYRSDLYYTDIKIENLLFKMEHGNCRIVFGDIGSISGSSRDRAVSTYPSNCRDSGHLRDPTIYDMTYGLMVIHLQMMNVDVRGLLHDVHLADRRDNLDRIHSSLSPADREIMDSIYLEDWSMMPEHPEDVNRYLSKIRKTLADQINRIII